MSILNKLNIARSQNKTSNLFEKLVPNFWDVKYDTPSEYVHSIWDSYWEQAIKSNSQI